MIYEHEFLQSFLIEFDQLPEDLKDRFIKKIKRLKEEKARRHLKFGLPYFVENVTSSARIVYRIEGNKLIFYRCFKNHKEYEKWFNSI
ncbi:MAG: hypothetical protein V1824_02260 [archaeon]